jgi:serine/threonine protein kinase
LKLENILLDRNRNVIITDFGFSNLVSSSSDGMLATSCGSPCYAAPELVINEKYVGELADIWSCGVILYAMLCGTLPFEDDPENEQGEDMALLYKYIMNTKVKFPVPLNEKSKDLVERILDTNPLTRIRIAQIRKHPLIT